MPMGGGLGQIQLITDGTRVFESLSLFMWDDTTALIGDNVVSATKAQTTEVWRPLSIMPEPRDWRREDVTLYGYFLTVTTTVLKCNYAMNVILNPTLHGKSWNN